MLELDAVQGGYGLSRVLHGVSLRAGAGEVPSRDHAESHSAWPLWPATRSWFWASRISPEDTGPRREAPLPHPAHARPANHRR